MLDFATSKKLPPEITIAPLIDIVFLLLLFFSMTSSFMQIQGLDLDLPKTKGENGLDLGTKINVISVMQDGRVFLDKEEVKLSMLKEKLSALSVNKQNEVKINQQDIPEDRFQDISILLQVENSATTQQLVSVMEIVNDAHVKNLSLETVN